MKSHLNFYTWLTDEEYGKDCKDRLVQLYEEYFNEKDENKKQEIFKQLEIYLAVVCDVIAYRYLVKHYTNLFYKLCITVEEYLDYKVKRLLVTIKEKDDHIEDILSYVYMSFMLSSPRLIYDYGEKIGRCKLVKENLPYFLVARNKFFDNNTDDITEHVIFNVDTLYLDEDTETDKSVRSNIDKYSYSEWKNRVRSENDGETDYQYVIQKIKSVSSDYSEQSVDYLLDLVLNWKTVTENDYYKVKLDNGFGDSYSLLDYVKYCYENGKTNLDKNNYIEILKILNALLKEN
nr:hypothetical protein DGKKSRWO_DGKKSRWO_CDS_0105 [uncultured phage]CAI9752282.1 hypothetical protein CVNMHQAP_CVNMHQAP_CDS_0105 [uncultured phage]